MPTTRWRTTPCIPLTPAERHTLQTLLTRIVHTTEPSE